MTLFSDTLAWLVANFGNGDLWQALGVHVFYTVISVLIAAAIAVPIGYYIGHTGKGREIAVGISGAARALPSFGLILLLISLVGVVQRPIAAFAAFVILAIPSILAGAYSGIQAIDRSTIDAARAVGMTEWQILWKVEAPLGLHLLVSGLRSGTLQVVATVTLAAYINLGGLGLDILQGIPLRRDEQVIGASLVVIALALLFDGLFGVMTHVVDRLIPDGSKPDSRHPRAPRPTDPVRSGGGTSHLPMKRKNMKVTARNKGRLAMIAAAVGVSLALAGCGSSPGDGSGDGSGDGDKATIVVGSQAYYSNEIVAEIYSQALEQAGYTVTRNFQIGQRDAYIPALEGGEVQVFPEYTGNLLQFYDPETTATKSDEVYAALADALPDSLAVLDQSSATDQDSYNVTREFADEYSLASIGDLAGVDVPVILGGAPELEERPYGPSGLESVYGVTVEFQATGDTTVDSLTQGVINVANVYSADPRIESAGLVTLDDPEGLFLASNVVPLVSADLAGELAEVLDPISAALTPEGLVAMNVESVDQQKSSADIATEWLQGNGFLD